MKRIVFLVLLFLFLIPFSVLGLVKPSSVLYVTDDAKVLSSNTENYFVRYSDFLSQNNQIQYYVVTVPNLEGYDLDTYVESVYSSFGIGSRGLLIFFSKEERTIKVIAGHELGLFLDDEAIQEGIDLYFMPYFKNDDWEAGIKNGYSAFYKMICNYYDIDSTEMIVFDGKDIVTKFKYPILLVLLFFSSSIAYIFCKTLKRAFRSSKKSFSHYFTFGFSLLLNFLLLIIAYFIEPWSILIIMFSEGITFFRVFETHSNITLEDAVRLSKRDNIKKSRVRAYRKNSKKKKRP